MIQDSSSLWVKRAQRGKEGSLTLAREDAVFFQVAAADLHALFFCHLDTNQSYPMSPCALPPPLPPSLTFGQGVNHTVLFQVLPKLLLFRLRGLVGATSIKSKTTRAVVEEGDVWRGQKDKSPARRKESEAG